MFEILLTRYFAIAQWHHLSFAVISIALFGLSAGGVFIHMGLSKKPFLGKNTNSLLPICVAMAAVVPLSYFLVNVMPLDFIQLPFNPIQILYIGIAFLLFALPFFCVGTAVTMAYIIKPEKTGAIYAAAMIGSAFGAILPVFLIPIFGTGKLLIFCGVISLLPLYRKPARSLRLCILSLPLLEVLLFLSFPLGSGGVSITSIRASSYKTKAQLLAQPQTRITQSIETLAAQIDVVDGPTIRHAPGLSLTYRGDLPKQQSILIDGDSSLVLYEITNPKEAASVGFTHSSYGYIAAQSKQNVLIVQQGGGIGIPLAVFSNAANITVLEENRHKRKLLANQYAQFEIQFSRKKLRNFLSSGKKTFDVIHLDTWGSSMPGMSSFAEDYFTTKQAVIAYLKNLTRKGVFITTRRLLLPPSDSLRIFATVWESLREIGAKQPGNHIIILNSWDSYTIVCSKSAFSKTTIDNLRKYAKRLGFDLLYHPMITPTEANQFVFDSPHFKAIGDLQRDLNEDRGPPLSDYFLDIGPQTDNKPYQNRFVIWHRIKELYRATGKRKYTLLFSGEVLILILLMVGLLFSLALGTALLFSSRKKRNRGGFIRFCYFGCLGIGYMFLEIAVIKKSILLSGNATVSFTIVLTAMLITSGIGGFLSARYGSLTKVLPIVSILSILFLLFHQQLFSLLLRLPMELSFCLIILSITPLTLFAGMPFALGMQKIAYLPSQKASAWAANGILSVLSSIAAAAIAMFFGISVLLIISAAAYMAATILQRITFAWR